MLGRDYGRDGHPSRSIHAFSLPYGAHGYRIPTDEQWPTSRQHVSYYSRGNQVYREPGRGRFSEPWTFVHWVACVFAFPVPPVHPLATLGCDSGTVDFGIIDLLTPPTTILKLDVSSVAKKGTALPTNRNPFWEPNRNHIPCPRSQWNTWQLGTAGGLVAP
jgi:hypothetical protein